VGAAWASRLYLKLPSWAGSPDLEAHLGLVACLELEAQEEVRVVWAPLHEGLMLYSIRDRRDMALDLLRLS
jgi:hypothetical protein